MTETQPRDPENKFVYSYAAPTAEERAEIESIRRSYRREAPDGMERLRLLDKAAKRPAAWCSRGLGACGIALFGGGACPRVRSKRLAFRQSARGRGRGVHGGGISRLQTALFAREKEIWRRDTAPFRRDPA